MLVHEILKGYWSILAQTGLKGSDEEAQATVDRVDKLEYEPEDFAVGTHIQESLEELYNNARVFNKVAFEVFLTNLYREDDAAAFVAFIENLINNRLTAAQQQWAEDHMEPMAEEDDEDMEEAGEEFSDLVDIPFDFKTY